MNRQEEFLSLYNPSHDQFTRFCHAMVGNREDAKDLISETVLKAFENLDEVQKKSSFTAYLIGIARHIYYNKQRRRWLLQPLSTKTSIEFIDNQMKTDLSIEIVLLYEALSKLPIKQKEAIVLFEITGFSLKEVAKIQKSGLSAVKARLRRGRVRLKNLLTDQEVSQIKKEDNYDQKIITC